MDIPNSCPLLREMEKVKNVLSTGYQVGAVVEEQLYGEAVVSIVHLVVLRTDNGHTHIFTWR